MAMTAPTLPNPRARAISAWIWEFTPSARPLPGPPSSVAKMRSLKPGERLGELDELGDPGPPCPGDQPDDQRPAPAALDLEGLAELLFHQVRLVQLPVVGGTPASEVRWLPVSFLWSLRSAYIDWPSDAAWSCLPVARSSAAVRRRT
jgi:hypothetical protein